MDSTLLVHKAHSYIKHDVSMHTHGLLQSFTQRKREGERVVSGTNPNLVR